MESEQPQDLREQLEKSKKKLIAEIEAAMNGPVPPSEKGATEHL